MPRGMMDEIAASATRPLRIENETQGLLTGGVKFRFSYLTGSPGNLGTQ
jgi:hypothetical protein